MYRDKQTLVKGHHLREDMSEFLQTDRYGTQTYIAEKNMSVSSKSGEGVHMS